MHYIACKNIARDCRGHINNKLKSFWSEARIDIWLRDAVTKRSFPLPSLWHQVMLDHSAPSAQGNADLSHWATHWAQVPAVAHAPLVRYRPNCACTIELLLSLSSYRPLTPDADGGRPQLSSCLASSVKDWLEIPCTPPPSADLGRDLLDSTASVSVTQCAGILCISRHVI